MLGSLDIFCRILIPSLDHVVTGVSDHKNVKTHEITLNKLKMTTLHENTFSLATA